MDGFFQSRNLVRSAVAASPLSEEERNLEKWPMTSSDCHKMTSSTLITQHYTNLATYDDNQSRIVSIRWTAEMLIEKGQDNRSMAHKTRAGRRIMGEQDRS